MKAMILAAGRGTRLAPLTDELPKPLFPVVGEPLIGLALQLARRHGVVSALVNLHHRGSMIRQALGRGTRWGVDLHYSEEEELLGTGGGLKKAEDFFRPPAGKASAGLPREAFETDFLIINADILADLDLSKAIALHKSRKATATMILVPPRPGAKPEEGLVGTDAEGRIVRISDKLDTGRNAAHWGAFTGIHIMNARAFEYMPPAIPFCVNAYLYPKLHSNGHLLYAHTVEGHWADLGTFHRYFRTVSGLLSGSLVPQILQPFTGLRPVADESTLAGGAARIDEAAGPVRTGERIDIGAQARIVGPAALENGVRVGAGARIGPGVVLGAGAVVGAEAVVTDSIVFPGARIKAGEKLDRTLVAGERRVRVATE